MYAMETLFEFIIVVILTSCNITSDCIIKEEAGVVITFKTYSGKAWFIS